MASANEQCKSCKSPNIVEFNAEISLHYPGLEGLNKAPIFLFLKVVICVDCCFLQSSLSTKDLSRLTDASRANPTLTLASAGFAKPAPGDDMQNRDGRREKRSPTHSGVLFFTGAQPLLTETATTKNLSSHGARLLTERPSLPNVPISIKLPSAEWVQARVVYCERVPDKFFAIGVEFLHPQPI